MNLFSIEELSQKVIFFASTVRKNQYFKNTAFLLIAIQILIIFYELTR